MAFTEVSGDSWFGRIGKSISSVIFGLVLFLISFAVLFFNEGWAVHTAKSLEEGKKSVVSVDAAKVDAANEGKLVHFSAKAINATGQPLVDSTFGISQDAIHLSRKVEMYQWKQDEHDETHKDMVGGGTTTTKTYTYHKIWSANAIDSNEFKEAGHANPSQWRFKGTTLDAPTVTAGAFTLDSNLAGQIRNFTPVSITEQTKNGLSAELKKDAAYSDNALYFANAEGQAPNPESPEVGDLKVTFEAALPGDVSVIAMQQGTTLAPFQTKYEPIEKLESGTHTAAEMFKHAEDENNLRTWILRGVGFILMWIGLAMILSPLAVLSDVIGIVGDIVGAGIGLVTGLVAITLSVVTIAVAWITYRPILGIGMLVIAGGVMSLIIVLRSKAATSRKAVTAPAA